MTDVSASAAGAIELLPARRRRLEETPLARATGFQLTDCAGGKARAWLPASECIRTSVDDHAIHPHAFIGFLDHLAGYAVASCIDENIGVSTMELQVAFTGVQPVGAVRGVAECVSPIAPATMVLARATDATGAIVATCSGWFAVGAFPGGFRDTAGIAEPVLEIGSVTGPYDRLIGLSGNGEGGACLAPSVVPAIGWTGLPALHGGAIGALLARACEERLAALDRPGFRLATITIRYLRAARADGLSATATCDWPGRRAAHLTARCFPQDGPDSAQAQAFFVPASR